MSDEEYCEYYKAYKKLCELHKKFGANNVPPVPTLFSENLCRHVLGLSKCNNRKYDAMKGKQTYEIKATCLPNKTVSFSKENKPNNLLWVQIDLKNDTINILNLDVRIYNNLNLKMSRPSKHLLKYIIDTKATITFDVENLKMDICK